MFSMMISRISIYFEPLIDVCYQVHMGQCSRRIKVCVFNNSLPLLDDHSNAWVLVDAVNICSGVCGKNASVDMVNW